MTLHTRLDDGGDRGSPGTARPGHEAGRGQAEAPVPGRGKVATVVRVQAIALQTKSSNLRLFHP